MKIFSESFDLGNNGNYWGCNKGLCVVIITIKRVSIITIQYHADSSRLLLPARDNKSIRVGEFEVKERKR